jgi:hypothetical protein
MRSRLLRALGTAACFGFLPVALVAGPPDDGPASPTSPAESGSKWRSPDDGWVDLSAFLDEPYGFVPIVWPVTEPAVGYGAAVALAFVGKPGGSSPGGFDQTNLTGAAGLWTENGTWGAAAEDSRYWMDNRLQTLVQAFGASVNLDFYGIGASDVPADHPLAYNLQPVGGVVGAKYRLGRSRAWLGLKYLLATTKVSFDAPDGTPHLPDYESDSGIGGLTPTFTWDSRDSLFTPGRGTYVETAAGFFGRALGGDDDFQRVDVVAMQYVPLHRKLTLGVRGDASFSFGDMPFYMRPFVDLRGVPKMRYQGEHVAKVEVELRWQFWKRFSLVGFGGDGAAWIDLDRFEKKSTVASGGAGFRYELARKYKLHMGVDVAFGPDGAVFYLQFGSAWMRI